MTSRDDMVMIPHLREEGGRGEALIRAREERRMDRQRGRGGALRKIARARLAQRGVRRRRRRAVSGRGALATARGGRLFANPVGGIVAIAAVAGAVVARLGTGRSFGNMGANVNQMLLGDMDDRARANMRVRKHFTGNEHLMRMVGRQGRISDALRSIHADMVRVEKQAAVGQSMIEQDPEFQINGLLDALILRARNAVIHGWKAVAEEGR